MTVVRNSDAKGEDVYGHLKLAFSVVTVGTIHHSEGSQAAVKRQDIVKLLKHGIAFF